jgi:uncharacterized protein YecT (DUF1311 family)
MVPTGRGLPAVALFVGVALVLSFRVAAHTPVAECEALAPMTEVKRCYNERVDDVDREVERAYRRAIVAARELDAVTGHGDAVPALEESQALWRAFHRTDCMELRAKLAAGGSGTGVFIARCAIDTAKTRISELNEIAGDIPQTVRPEPPSVFACRGNEPFWDLAIDGKKAEYGRLDGTSGRSAAELTGDFSSLGYLRPQLVVWRGRGEPKSSDLVAIITRERCVDTMAEKGLGGGVFGYQVRISLPGGEVRVGCCSGRD